MTSHKGSTRTYVTHRHKYVSPFHRDVIMNVMIVMCKPRAIDLLSAVRRKLMCRHSVLAETWAGDVEGTALMARGSPGLIEWAGIARVERKRIWWRVNGSRNAIASLTVNLAVSPCWCMLNLSVVIKIDGYVSAGIEKTRHYNTKCNSIHIHITVA